jgi:hypothetical protein
VAPSGAVAGFVEYVTGSMSMQGAGPGAVGSGQWAEIDESMRMTAMIRRSIGRER